MSSVGLCFCWLKMLCFVVWWVDSVFGYWNRSWNERVYVVINE